jgi:dCMP deaminase
MKGVKVSGVPYQVDIEDLGHLQGWYNESARINIHDYFMGIASLVSKRATCARRQGGCILVDKNNHVLATGYNGVPSGFDHCIDVPCPGARSKSGKDLDKCEAIHAEQNALLQCSDVQTIYACYTTTRPCIHCIKLLLNTSCRVIVFKEDYPHREMVIDLWQHRGHRQFVHIGE